MIKGGVGRRCQADTVIAGLRETETPESHWSPPRGGRDRGREGRRVGDERRVGDDRRVRDNRRGGDGRRGGVDDAIL